MANKIFPNHVFDPNPPAAFYGTPNEFIGRENPTNRISIAQPGIGSGLYRPEGPINIMPAQEGALLIDVKTKPRIALHMDFHYTHRHLDHSIDIEADKLYTFSYVDSGVLKRCSGRVVDIFKVDSLDKRERLYKIKIDCSSNYDNRVVILKSDMIRFCHDYIPYVEEDPTLEDSIHKFGTTAATFIENVIITNATLDENKNIVSGKITSGIITQGITSDGIANGYNCHHHKIYVKYGKTSGGIIESGNMIYATLKGGDISDGIVDENGITRGATVEGTLANAIIINTTIKHGTTIEGHIFNPVMNNAVIKDALITGKDTITTDGITNGDITTKGKTTGGDISGGKAIGTIDGEYYTIVNPKIISTGEIITNGGTVTGGVVVKPGKKVGNLLVGTTVVGGTVTGGTTTSNSGITVTIPEGGDIIPVKPSEVDTGDTTTKVPVDDDYNAIPESLKREYEKYGSLDDIKKTMSYRELTNHYDSELLDNLLIGYDIIHGGKFWTNIKTTNIGRLDTMDT